MQLKNESFPLRIMLTLQRTKLFVRDFISIISFLFFRFKYRANFFQLTPGFEHILSYKTTRIPTTIHLIYTKQQIEATDLAQEFNRIAIMCTNQTRSFACGCLVSKKFFPCGNYAKGKPCKTKRKTFVREPRRCPICNLAHLRGSREVIR